MLTPVDPKSLDLNVFSAIGEKWMLITAGTADKCNTMTASWGGLGVIWGAPAATCYIRPQRYTKEFVDREEYFTLSFFPEEYRKQLSLCGSKSGRDVDKIKECGSTVCYGAGDAPCIGEAELVLVCKKAYVQDMDAACVLEEGTVLPFYGEKGGWHRMYTGLVVEAYEKES